MANITKLLKEQWEMMKELYELPNNIDTKILGDDIFSKGAYGERFEMIQPVKGKSGKVYRVTFAFMKRERNPTDKTREAVVADKKGNKPIVFQESVVPLYEMSFYPSDREGTSSQWGMLNDVSATEVIALSAYYALYHASELFKMDTPVPFIDYIFRPYKEKAEKDAAAKDSKRGSLYNRAIPRVLQSLESKFPNVEITDHQVHPEYTMVFVKKA